MADPLFAYRPVDPFTGRQDENPQPLPDFLKAMPRMAEAARPNPIGAGLRAGFNEFQGMLGDAVGALGRGTGLDGLAEWGQATGEKNYAEAQEVGRPDLEIAPWREGGASVLPWLAYQTAKQGPQLAAALVAGAAMPQAAVPAGLARLGAMAPGWLGGGGLSAGASFAARKAAMEAGEGFARGVVGAQAVGMPLAVGSQYREAVDAGNDTAGEAWRAIAQSPFYAALDALEPAQLKGFVGGTLKGAAEGGVKGAAKSALKGAMASAAMEMPQEAAQTAMELSFRPDMSLSQKASQIVDAALTGGAVGGVLGGGAGAIGGARRLKDTPPQAADNDTLKGVVDEVLTTAPDGQIGMNLPEQRAPQRQLTPEVAAPEDTTALDAALARGGDMAGAGSVLKQNQLERALQNERERRAGATEQQSPLAQVPDDDLQQAMAVIETRYREGVPVTPQEEQTYARLWEENARRYNRAQAAAAQGELPFPEAPQPPQVAAEVEATRAKARQLAGVKEDAKSWLDEVEAADDRQLALAVAARLDDGAKDKQTDTLANELGLYITPEEISRSEAELERKWLRARQTGEGVKEAQEYQKKVADLRAKFDFAQGVVAEREQAKQRATWEAIPEGTQFGFEGMPATRGKMKMVPDRAPAPVQIEPATMPASPGPLFTQPTPVVPAPSASIAETNNAVPDLVPQPGTPAQLATQAQETLATAPEMGPLAQPIARELTFRAAQEQRQEDLFRQAEQGLIEQEEAGVVPEPLTVRGINRSQDKKSGVTYNVQLSNGSTVPLKLKAVGADRGVYLGEERVGATLQEAAMEVARRGGEQVQPRIRYRQGSPLVERPAEVAAVQDVVSEITANWKGEVPVRVLDTPEQLSDDIYADLVRDGMTNAYGLAVDGTVYIFASNLPDASTARATLFHEALGHIGLERQFGDKLDTLLRQMLSNPRLRAEAEAWRKAHPKAYGGSLVRAVEEVLARRSEFGPQVQTLWERVVALVRDFGRKIGVVTEFSDADINAILATAHRAATGRFQQKQGRGGNRYMYVGEKALEGLDLDEAVVRVASLRLAQDLERRGDDEREIRVKTGWFRNPYDKKWRWEVSDADAVLTEAFMQLPESKLFGKPDETFTITLREALNHPLLFRLYPELGDVTVVRRPAAFDGGRSVQGSFYQNTINITPYAMDPLGTLLHEVQHWIQGKELFARGANSETVFEYLSDARFDKEADIVATNLTQAIRSRTAYLTEFERLVGTPNIGRMLGHFDLTHRAYKEWEAAGKPKTGQLKDVWIQLVRAGDRMLDEFSTRHFGLLPRDLKYSDPRSMAWEKFAIEVRKGFGAREELKKHLGFEIGAYKQMLLDAEALTSGDRGRMARVLRGAWGKGLGFRLYEQVAGEIEARDTTARRAEDASGRAAATPYSSQGVAPEDSILVNVDVETASQADPYTMPVDRQNEALQRVMAALEPQLEQVSQQAAATGSTATAPPAKPKKGLPGLPLDVRNRVRRDSLYWSSLGHIVEFYGKLFDRPGGKNPIREYAQAHGQRTFAEQRLAQLALKPLHDYEQLTDKQAVEDIAHIMGATVYDVDPAKSWQDQPHLHDRPDADIVRKHVAEYNRRYARLRQKGHLKVYEDFKAVNEATYFAQHTMGLYNLVVSNPDIAQNIPSTQGEIADTSPMTRFLRESGAIENPQEARAYWKAQSDRLLSEVRAFVDSQYGLMTGLKKAERDEIVKHASPLDARIKQIEQQQEAMQRAPYFHLGRFGNFFVAFNVPAVPDGKLPDLRKQQQIAKRLEKEGFDRVQMVEGGDRRNVFVRLDNAAQAEHLKTVLRELEQQGLVEQGSTQGGPRDENEGSYRAHISKLMERVSQEIEGSDIFVPDEGMSEEQKKALENNKRRMKGLIQQIGLDLLPDISIAKVMTHRDTVPGYTKDMVRSYAFRTQVGAHALANMAAAPMLDSAFVGMKAAVNEAKAQPGTSIYPMHQVRTELMTREGDRPINTGYTWLDAMRAYNHAYFLGLSPAYALVNMTQPMTLLWPELAKKGGFVNAAKAIANVTPTALKIVGHVLRTAGKGHVWDATITEDALKAAGVSQADARFIMRIVSHGVIDIGSASREHGRVVEDRTGSKHDKVLRVAASFGYYTELSSRLIAALAARKVNPAGGDDYVVDVVQQSMLNYSSWNIARATSKSGFAGRMTPLVMSFMQYTAQVIEKLGREIYYSFRGDKESQRYLLTHMAAVTAIAGSLGLPAATLFATALEKMVDLADDDEEPFDAKAAWRNFLADTFGPELGEILSRGAPRALGFDISQRAGEADIIPFTRLLADKRDWREATRDWAMHALGSPFSMGANIASGMEKVAHGNVIAGAREGLPIFMRNMVEAYRMTDRGYTDTAGNVLPMSPGAGAILYQLVGLNPQEKAEYTEARTIQTTRKGELIRNATNIRRNLAVAIESGDGEAARSWMAEARKFDSANPAYAVLPGMPGVLRQRARARAMASATGLPMGAKTNDPQGAALTRFANY